jgi:hypothetical protein
MTGLPVCSPDADMLLVYYDADGCCVGSDLVPADEVRYPGAPRAVYFTAGMVVGSGGVEPPASDLSGRRSNHMSYEPAEGGGPDPSGSPRPAGFKPAAARAASPSSSG